MSPDEGRCPSSSPGYFHQNEVHAPSVRCKYPGGFGGLAPHQPRRRRLPTTRGKACAQALRLAWAAFRAYIAAMSGFIYFDITDHARLPARFFGMTRNVLARG